MFETEQEVLGWYENQPRAATKSFISSFPWNDVKNNPLRPDLVPVLVYMRDVESYTDLYYRELLRTPTGRDPIIRRFMERWVVEEADHGELLNRFLSEVGVPVEARWQRRAKAAIPARYTVENYIATCITNVFGRSFTGTHMVWGAINEMMTLQGYRRMSQAAGHPVLTKLLRCIVREESTHANFYWHMARLKLVRSRFSRRVARFVIKRFWTPVGEGAKPRSETDYVIATLFRGRSGSRFFERNVSERIERLPGLAELGTITNRVMRVSAALS